MIFCVIFQAAQGERIMKSHFIKFLMFLIITPNVFAIWPFGSKEKEFDDYNAMVCKFNDKQIMYRSGSNIQYVPEEPFFIKEIYIKFNQTLSLYNTHHMSKFFKGDVKITFKDNAFDHSSADIRKKVYHFKNLNMEQHTGDAEGGYVPRIVNGRLNLNLMPRYGAYSSEYEGLGLGDYGLEFNIKGISDGEEVLDLWLPGIMSGGKSPMRCQTVME